MFKKKIRASEYGHRWGQTLLKLLLDLKFYTLIHTYLFSKTKSTFYHLTFVYCLFDSPLIEFPILYCFCLSFYRKFMIWPVRNTPMPFRNADTYVLSDGSKVLNNCIFEIFLIHGLYFEASWKDVNYTLMSKKINWLTYFTGICDRKLSKQANGSKLSDPDVWFYLIIFLRIFCISELWCYA